MIRADVVSAAGLWCTGSLRAVAYMRGAVPVCFLANRKCGLYGAGPRPPGDWL